MTFFSRRSAPETREPDEPPAAEPAPVEPPAESAPPPLSLAQPIGFATVLGPSSEMKGSLRCEANVRLDGSFSGELQIGGNLLVGETARIAADIHARNVSVAGAVRGNIHGRKVQLLRTSRVWGDIEATALTTEEGAFIDGRITMVSHEAAREADAAFDAPPVIVSEAPAPAENDESESSPAAGDERPEARPDERPEDSAD